MENLNWRYGLGLALLALTVLTTTLVGGGDAILQTTLRPRLRSLSGAAQAEIRGTDGLPGLDACYLPAEAGRCEAYFPRFHFDAETGQCTSFIYGGCGGNGNNFETLPQCQAFGNRCVRGNQSPLPTRRPMSDREPLDLRWVGRNPPRRGVVNSASKPGVSGWSS